MTNVMNIKYHFHVTWFWESTHLPNKYYSKLNLCMCSPKIIHTDSMNYVCRNYVVQVNQCQKHSFLNQLTHNMTRDCSLNSPKNTSSELVVYKYCFECQYKKKTCSEFEFFWEFNEQSLVILWFN